MNKIYRYFYLLSFFLVLFSSCSEDEKTVEEEKLEYLNTLETFDVSGGNQSLSFFSSSDWSVQTDQAWCSVSPLQGKSGTHSIDVSVDTNDSYDERNATLILTSKTQKIRTTITQKQKDALFLSSSKCEISADGGIVEIDVRSNVDFFYSIDQNSTSWVKNVSGRSLNTTKLKFEVSKNTNSSKREAQITFTSDKFNEVFTIYQGGEEDCLVLSKDRYDIGSDGGLIKIELKSNQPYEIIMPDVDWVEESTSRSISSYTHFFSVAPNKTSENRNAQITFRHKETDKSETVTINQFQKDVIDVEQTEYQVTADGGIIIMNVVSNVNLDIVCASSWIERTQPNSRSLEKHQFAFKIFPNPSDKARTGIIELNSGELTTEVKVIQEGKKQYGIEVNQESISFGKDADTKEIKMISQSDWTARTNKDWCKVSPLSGNKGTHIIRLKSSDIFGIAQRTDTLYLESGNVCKKVPIIQNNQDSIIVITPDLHLSGINDTIVKVDLRSSYNVQFEIDPSAEKWIIPHKSRSLVDSQLEFEVLKNEGVLKRSGVITFKNGTKSQKFTITQEGKGMFMKLEPERVEIGSAASEFDVTVTSNYKSKVYIKGEPEWIKEISSETLSAKDAVITVTKYHFKVSENTTNAVRAAYIYFLNTEYKEIFGQIETKYVRAFQDNKTVINITNNRYHIKPEGQDLDIEVASNITYSVSVSDKWIKKIPDSRASIDTTTLKFHIDRNLETQPRTDNVI